LVREAIDRFVSAIAPSLELRAPPGTPETIETKMRQDLALGSMNQYLAQALRDAFVVGNGYVAFTSDPPAVYNLRPDLAAPGDSDLVAPRAGEKPVPAMHLRGLEQPGSVYGLGLVELALMALMQQETFDILVDRAQKFLASSDTNAREWASRTQALAERGRAANEKGLQETFSPLLTFTPAPVSDLYFPGAEEL
jgi:hypothetical protein